MSSNSSSVSVLFHHHLPALLSLRFHGSDLRNFGSFLKKVDGNISSVDECPQHDEREGIKRCYNAGSFGLTVKETCLVSGHTWLPLNSAWLLRLLLVRFGASSSQGTMFQVLMFACG